jgi:beta-lactamase superfamily II metal-dependent hydrolase
MVCVYRKQQHDQRQLRRAFILQYKHFRILFTGDAGVAAEQRFLSERIDLHADVLKVGHHGSRYSSSPAPSTPFNALMRRSIVPMKMAQ